MSPVDSRSCLRTRTLGPGDQGADLRLASDRTVAMSASWITSRFYAVALFQLSEAGLP
jgi:hypothetical protein